MAFNPDKLGRSIPEIIISIPVTFIGFLEQPPEDIEFTVKMIATIIFFIIFAIWYIYV